VFPWFEDDISKAHDYNLYWQKIRIFAAAARQLGLLGWDG
jgi:hypothetical protein